MKHLGMLVLGAIAGMAIAGGLSFIGALLRGEPEAVVLVIIMGAFAGLFYSLIYSYAALKGEGR